MPTYAVSAGRSGKEDSTLEIGVMGRTVNGGETINAGSEGENEVTRLVFSGLPLLSSGQTVTLHWAAEVSGTTVGSVELLTKQTGVYKYEYEITDAMSQYNSVDAYLQVVSGEKKWKSYAFHMDFANLPDADGSATPPDPTLIDDAIAALNEAIEQVAGMDASVTKSGRTVTITITGPEGETSETVTDGGVFTPSVSSAGVLSWTNNAGETNPESVDLAAAVIAALPSAVGVSF